MVNRVFLIGRVGQTPEIKHLESGSVVANFSMATSETYKDKNGEKVEDTEWSNIVIWGKLAEVVEKYVKKGDLLYVEGKKKTRSWEKDNVKHYATDIVVSNLTMLGGNQTSNEVQGAETRGGTPEGAKNGSDGNETNDLPF